MEKEISKLESEIASLELLLKWKGIPTFAFISGLAALTWAFLLEFNPSDYKQAPVVISVFVARIIWSVLSDSFFANSSIRESLDLFKSFMTDIKNEVKFEILLDMICVVYLSNLPRDDFSVWLLYSYFALNFCFNFAALFMSLMSEELNMSAVTHLSRVKWIEKKWLISSQKMIIFFLKFYFLKVLLEFQVMSLVQVKQCLIFVGIMLFVQFYFVGSYILTLLETKRKKLHNLL